MTDPVDEVGAQLEQLDLITPERSLTLMSKRIGRALEETEQEEVLKLAEAVGYLSIALELVAARVARKTLWSDLIYTLEQEVAHLESLSGPHHRRKEETRLEACFNLSLNALRDDDIEVWQNFVWLGVLPDDALVAAPMAATLWSVEEAEAAERLELLWNDALLLPSPSIQVGERTWPAYRLHEFLHDLVRRLLTTNQATGLGIPLATAHAELLKRYRVRTQSDLWHTLADDSYIHAHLTWHLEKAGWVDEIHKLLREETSSGRNGWQEACERLGQTAIFVADVARAWRSAEDLFEDHPSRAISLQCRYALIVSTLNSLSADSPHSLQGALLQKHVSVAQQGLAYALQSSNAETKAILLTEISDYLPQNLKQEALQKALAATRAIQYEQYRLNALETLTPKLPPELLPEALTIARTFPSGINRVEALKALAPKLPPDLLPDALAIARAFRHRNDEWCRALALSALASKLPEVIPDALAAARAVQYNGFGNNLSEELQAQALQEASLYRAGALTAVADFLPEKLQAEVLQEALTAARAYEEEWQEWRRAIALSDLAPKLPEKLQAEVLQEALVIARADEDDWSRAVTLSDLAPKLPPELLPEALAAARAIQSECDRATALIALAFEMPEVIPEALAATRAIQHRLARANALIDLVPKLPPELLPEALAAARDIGSESARTKALIALASKLSKMQTAELYPLWQTILRSLSSQTRRDFLHDLLALASVICALGDREAVAEVLSAIQDVRRWWS